MKKNRTMRVAALLLALTLMTSCFVGGTFAKYTSSANSLDAARVAYWGWQPTTMDLTGLFSNTYTNVDSTVNNSADVIAPGTTGSTTFSFNYNEANGLPEVAYEFSVAVVGTCDDAIKNNGNIQWKLDSGEWITFDALIAALKALSGDVSGTKTYDPGELPDAFGAADTVHTISWRWIYSNSAAGDAMDTAMGNAADLADVSISITITATQID